MKVANIIAGLGAGGAESSLNLLGNYASKQKNTSWDVFSLSNEISSNFELKNKKFNLKSFLLPFNFLLLAMELKKIKYNKYLFWMYDAAFISILLSPMLNCKPNWYIHHNLLNFKNESIKLKTQVKILSLISHTFFVEKIFFASKNSMNLHIKKLKFNPKKCVYCPIGFDEEKFIFKPPAGEKILKIGNFGRFSKVKNHQFLFNLCKKLKDREVDFELHLAGIGMEKNNTLLLDMLKKSELYNETFLYGETQDIPNLYRNIDLYILCSLSEAFPLVIGESLLTGIYAISNELGDVGEMIKLNGKIIKNLDIDEYVNAIDQFVKMSEEKKIYKADANRKFIAKNFSVENQLNTLLSTN